MSIATKEALDQAIRAHIADECPESPLVTAWVCITEETGYEDDRLSHVMDVTMDNQSNTMTIGLAFFLSQARTQTWRGSN